MGAVPHLRQEDGGSKEDEKVSGVDQLSAPACYEKWEVRAGIQTDSEDDQTGQSEIGDPHQQLPSLQVILTLLEACQNRLVKSKKFSFNKTLPELL